MAMAPQAARSFGLCRMRRMMGTMGRVAAMLPTQPSQNHWYPLGGRRRANSDPQYTMTSRAATNCHHSWVDCCP